MGEVFHATHLRRDQARRAFPLVRVHDPHVTLKEWLAFVWRWTRMPERRGGLVSVADVRGYLHALFSYRIEIDLLHGRLMRVSNLIIGHLPGQAVRSTVVATIERLAEDTGCSSVAIDLAQAPAGPNDVAIRNALAGAGFAPCAVSLLRQEPAHLRPPVTTMLRLN
jgi:hypothetical protein